MIEKIRATRRIQFCAGHRVHEHGSKCRNLHGHNYVAYITIEAPKLDKLGMVTDFSVIKDKVGAWIDENWDHGFIYFSGDFGAKAALLDFENHENRDRNLTAPSERGPEFRQKLFEMQMNPTAENMAFYLLHKANGLFGNPAATRDSIRCVKVVLYETENCSAEVELQD